MKAKLVFLLLVFATLLQAQEVANKEALAVSADRPGMATGVGVLPFKTIQWETGFQWDYADCQHSFTLPTTMLRFGVGPPVHSLPPGNPCSPLTASPPSLVPLGSHS